MHACMHSFFFLWFFKLFLSFFFYFISFHLPISIAAHPTNQGSRQQSQPLSSSHLIKRLQSTLRFCPLCQARHLGLFRGCRKCGHSRNIQFVINMYCPFWRSLVDFCHHPLAHVLYLLPSPKQLLSVVLVMTHLSQVFSKCSFPLHALFGHHSNILF